MTARKVIAFTLTDDDLEQVRAEIENARFTNSFAVGELDDRAIRRLRKAGIVVELLDQPGALAGAETDDSYWGAFKDLLGAADSTSVTSGPLSEKVPNATFGGGKAPGSVPGVLADRIYTYLLRTKGPLLDEWQAELDAAGVQLMERQRDNTFLARLKSNNLTAIRALDFVDSVELFDATQTQKRWKSVAVQEDAPAFADEPTLWDLLLHSPDDRKGLETWLKAEGIKIVASSAKKVRVKEPDPLSKLDETMHHLGVKELEQHVPPMTCNDQAQQAIGLVHAGGGGVPFALTGAEQIVGIADTGLDVAHPDFEKARIIEVIALGRKDDSSDPAGHGTHVAATLLGSGAASTRQYAGAAPQAKLVFQSLLDASGHLTGIPADLGSLFQQAYDKGARIHNNSWGSSYGAGLEAFYRIYSRELDEFVDRQRDMLIVVAAGNQGSAETDNNPSRQSGFVDWASMLTPATAKNALTVGASRSSRAVGGWSGIAWGKKWSRLNQPPLGTETISGDAEEMAGFSGRGPCAGVRIKPDVVAPGTDIVSARSSIAPDTKFWAAHENAKYAYMGGTSMAAPLVAGCAALVREYYTRIRKSEPSAALLKATLVNGTAWLTGKGATADRDIVANYHQGFGRVDMQTTLPGDGLGLAFSDDWQANFQKTWLRTGQRALFRFALSGGRPLRVCLTWTDPAGPGLQNVLGLRLEHQSRRWHGNQPPDVPAERFDRENNVQIVRLSDAPEGDYLVSVIALNLLRPGQDFALVVVGALVGEPSLIRIS